MVPSIASLLVQTYVPLANVTGKSTAAGVPVTGTLNNWKTAPVTKPAPLFVTVIVAPFTLIAGAAIRPEFGVAARFSPTLIAPLSVAPLVMVSTPAGSPGATLDPASASTVPRIVPKPASV